MIESLLEKMILSFDADFPRNAETMPFASLFIGNMTSNIMSNITFSNEKQKFLIMQESRNY